ncbi:hypothetical protein GCM10022419_045310 [Nonomuraea rosea]|uniref:Uncharacterized protein n=1 Tax=Nonomuraea rosea TaxID=638574 RepID=A0ABP6X2A3_9ACTN
MVRRSQVEKIKTAVRELDTALKTGNRTQQERCYAVLEAVQRNSSNAEINAAIDF